MARLECERTCADMNSDGGIVARRTAWIAMLTAAVTLFSFALACATPFPALAALAALHLRRSDALALTGIAWVANQAIGYGFLGYPQTWDSFAWGGVIGLSALAATAVAIGAETLTRRAGRLAAAVVSFTAAFIAYEAALCGTTAFLPSGPEAFSAPIVMWILRVNALAFVALMLVQSLGDSLGWAVRRDIYRKPTAAA